MIDEVRRILSDWYHQNGRSLPWRDTKDPYFIWLSEIILQQTRVNQGMPYYLAFVKAYPTITHLADANEQEVLRLWQGLGYYSRARNLHSAAKYVAYQLNGVFPKTYQTIKELSGVGDYTASAISSVAYGEEKAVLDGNVFRVLSRIFLIKDDISAGASRKVFLKVADELLNRESPGDHNQAIMDFGAMQCAPKPKCEICPMEHLCMARQQGLEKTLPVKLKKIKRTKRYFHYFLIGGGEGLYLNKRGEKDIWQGLFELPLIEAESGAHLEASDLVGKFGNRTEKPQILPFSKVHKLTHMDVNAFFYRLDFFDWESPSGVFVSWNELDHYPLPRLIDEFLEDYVRPQ